MFAETLLESGVARQPSRRWATTASFSMQLLALAVLVVLPSVYPEMMSVHRAPPVSVPIFSAPPPPSQAQPLERQSGSSVTSPSIPIINVSKSALTFGKRQEQVDPGPAPEPTGLNPLGRGAGIPDGFYVAPLKPPDHTEPLRLSHMDPGSLTRSIPPAYPQIAKVAGIQGQVVLTAIISKSGEIESLQTVSGHPMLVAAAKNAVSQWRYRPYILNGEPIEVETQITVNFKLGN